MKFALLLSVVLLLAISDAHDPTENKPHSHEKAHTHAHGHGHAHSHSHSHEEHEHEPKQAGKAKPPTTGAHQHHGHDHKHDHSHGHDAFAEYIDLIDKYTFGYGKHLLEWAQDLQPKIAAAPKWAQAMMAVLAISLAPNLMMLVLPFGSAGKSNTFRRLSLAFASGSLLGDAFLHLIPHSLAEVKSKMLAANPHEADEHGLDEQASVRVGLCVLCGILLFLGVERLIRLFSGSSHSHSHSHATEDSDSDHQRKAAGKQDAAAKAKKAQKAPAKGSHGKEKASEKGGKLTIAAVLNLIADVSHNFTDGLAIGAAFSANVGLGLSTTASMFFHELPHELGDIAILVQGGFSKWRACALQFVTAFGAFGGCAFAFLLEGTRFDELILPLTAGGFIYVSTAGVLPELLNASESEAPASSRPSRFASAVASLAEMMCAFGGIAVMYAMCALEVHAH